MKQHEHNRDHLSQHTLSVEETCGVTFLNCMGSTQDAIGMNLETIRELWNVFSL